MLSKVSLIGALTFMIAGLAMAQNGDATRGQSLYATCIACHGANGEGLATLGGPRLAGQDGWYLARQIQNFKAGLRGANPQDTYGAQMRAMVMTLTTEQAVNDVVAYIETLEAPEPERTVQAGDATRGQGLYVTCIACHGANGEGNASLGAPGLTGQHDWYLARQIQNFKAGLRGANPQDTYGAQMRAMAMTLTTEQAINDVVAYIMTLE